MYRRQLRNQTSTKLFLYVIPENTRRKKKREKERRERDPDDGNLWWVTINPRALVIQKGLSLVSPPISSTYQPISGISSSVRALFEPFSNRDDLYVDLHWIFSILESFVSYGSVTNRRDSFHWYFLDQKFVSLWKYIYDA